MILDFLHKGLYKGQYCSAASAEPVHIFLFLFVCVSKVQAALKSVSAESQGPKPIHGPSTRSFSTALGREQTENVLLLAVAVEGALFIFGLYF